MITLRPTKEVLVAALALVLSGTALKARIAIPVSPGPLPRVPAVEAAADVAKEEIPVAKPLLVKDAFASEGRDPFAASDIWEDPTPSPIPIPPELGEERIVPFVSIGAGRARAPRPPRILGLPQAEAAAPPPAEKKP